MGKVYLDGEVMSLRNQLTRRLLRLQKDRGYVADSLGINRSKLNQMWTGKTPFTVGVILEVCNFLDVDIKPFLDEICEDYISHRNKLGKRLETKKAAHLAVLACAFDREDLLHRIADRLLEDHRKNLKVLLEIGKELYSGPKSKYSLYFFNEIIKESDRRTDVLAQALFYRFMLLRYERKGLEALLNMMHSLDALPFSMKPEALLQIVIYYSLRDDWDNVKKYSLHLQSIYQEAEPAKRSWYLGYSLLYQGFTAREMGDYTTALKFIDTYETIDTHFAGLAKSNRMYVLIASGSIDVIPMFVEHLETKPINEQVIGLSLVLEQYIKADMIEFANAFLNKFSAAAEYLMNCQDTLNKKRAIRFLMAKNQLEICNNRPDKAVDLLLDALDKAQQIRSLKRIKECILLLDERQPTEEQKKRMVKILKEDVLYA